MINTYPKLETERLFLTRVYADDIPQIVTYAGDAKIAETTLNLPHPYEEKDAVFWINLANQGYINQNNYIFAIRLKPDQFMGGCGLRIEERFERAEIGYWIGTPFWNQGYVTEAVSALIQYGFEELDLNKIYSTHIASNLSSGRVMQKNHMIKEAEMLDHIKKEGTYHTLIQYRLTRDEYLKLKTN